MALHGTSKQYIVERLEREGHTALLEAVRNGQITALTAAASLGWVQRPPPMGGSTHQAHRRDFRLRKARGELGPGEKMELIYGPSPAMGSCFASREALRAAWTAVRDELLGRANPGRRPAAFYEFEFDGLRPQYGEERSTLWRMNLLSAEEKVALETEWKAAFAEAQAPDFTLNDGSGELLTGDCARAEHYRHHDIPYKLIRRWEAVARRKRKKVAEVAEVPSEAENAPAARTGVAPL
jgi:hypothetical protein